MFLGNVAFAALPTDLLPWLAQHGVAARAVEGPRDAAGFGRGFGFVWLQDPSAAPAAIAALDGRHFRGKARAGRSSRRCAKNPPERGRVGTTPSLALVDACPADRDVDAALVAELLAIPEALAAQLLDDFEAAGYAASAVGPAQ